MAEVKELIGVDVGQAKSGLARASSIAKLAEPLNSVKTDQLIEVLQGFEKAQDLEALVIGLPRNLKGDDTAQTAWVRNWVIDAQTKLSTPLYWQDEALTSKNAQARGNQIDEHAMAAAIILQDFLDSPESVRQVC